jgi:uncharacterized Fe-S center protein
MKSKVYFSKNITADEIVKIYEKLGVGSTEYELIEI